MLSSDVVVSGGSTTRALKAVRLMMRRGNERAKLRFECVCVAVLTYTNEGRMVLVRGSLFSLVRRSLLTICSSLKFGEIHVN